MARLPYEICLANRTSVELASAVEWCQHRWPHTHGATWTVGFVEQGFVASSRGCLACWNRRWWFQREEDAVMFRLAWE